MVWYLLWCGTAVGEDVLTVWYLLWCSTAVGEYVVMVWYPCGAAVLLARIWQ